jgi:Phycobilisome protein
MAMELSDSVKDLIKKARIMDFSSWRPGHPPESIARFQQADDERRYLTDEDFESIAALAPKMTSLVPAARLLRDEASAIVDEARAELLQHFPGILEPGGRLYPQERADACWRDFWHFLRSITYGIAGGRRDFTSQVGLHHMEALYGELSVPIDAMARGLKEVKVACMKRFDESDRSAIGPYFDHLILHLENFGDD